MPWLRHKVLLYAPNGALIEELEGVIEVEASRVVNGVGVLKVTLPGDFDLRKLQVDSFLELHRRPSEGSLERMQTGIVRRLQMVLDQRGRETVVAYGADLNHFLMRRIVAYGPCSNAARKIGAADTLLYEIVEENLGATGGTGRDLSSILLIPPAPGGGPEVKWLDGSHQFVLHALQEISDKSVLKTPPTYFQVVQLDPVQFEFRTYLNQVGNDLSSRSNSQNPVVFSRQWGNLGQAVLDWDRSEEQNYIYVSEPGDPMLADIVPVYNEQAVGRSPYNRMEGWSQAEGADTEETGNEALEKYRPKLRFEGELKDTPAVAYGRHWQFGDVVDIEFRGWSFPAMVSAYHLTVDEEGEEHLRVFAEVEDVTTFG